MSNNAKPSQILNIVPPSGVLAGGGGSGSVSGTMASDRGADPLLRDLGPDAHFRVEKIENGYIVHLRQSLYSPVERHYVPELKQIGDFITATLVRWYIEDAAT